MAKKMISSWIQPSWTNAYTGMKPFRINGNNLEKMDLLWKDRQVCRNKKTTALGRTYA